MCYAASMSCGSAPSDCRASRGPSIAAWAALSSGLALCCCTAATSFDGFSRNVSGADEPTGAPPRFEVAPDTADAACELPLDAVFGAPPAPPWALSGFARWRAPGIELTPDLPNAAGLLVWERPMTFDRFSVDIAFTIEAGTVGSQGTGDGIGVAWIAGSRPPERRGAGEDMGLEGTSGFKVMIDTYKNPTDPDAPYVALARTDDRSRLATSTPFTRLTDGREHTLRVELDDGVVTAVVDGWRAFEPARIRGYEPFSGYLVIAAGTGGATALHTIQRVSIRSGRGGPCAP